MKTDGYKVFTNDLRSPIQRGEPVWNGTIPFDLPTVELDESENECGAGWNFCRSSSDALRIAGLWPNGRPSRLFSVSCESAIERGDKLRSSNLKIVDEITDIRFAITEMSIPFGKFAENMVNEQLEWRLALSRPFKNKTEIESGLREALTKRGLNWKLKQFKSAKDARSASGSWDACDSRCSSGARPSRAARNAWDTSAAGVSWSAMASLATWGAWEAMSSWSTRDIMGSRDANAAKNALTVYYASKKKWINFPEYYLTVGIRNAYKNGLEIAIPTGPSELGWSMERA